MEKQALRREAVAWFKKRLAADAWLDEVRAQSRSLRSVSAPAPRVAPRRPRRAGTKTHAA